MKNPLDRFKNLNGGTILDVATGTGEFLRELADAFESYDEAIGIDSNAERIKAAQEKITDGFRLVKMDAEKLDFEDNYFDTVAIRHSLHHMENLDTVLSEMKRVLRPGGLMVICEIFQSPDRDLPNAQRHIHHWWAEVDRAVGNYHGETYTREQIIDLLGPLGLQDVEMSEVLEEFEEADVKEVIEFVNKSVDDYIVRLQQAGDFLDIIERGRALKAVYQEQGIVNDKYLFVVGRK